MRNEKRIPTKKLAIVIATAVLANLVLSITIFQYLQKRTRIDNSMPTKMDVFIFIRKSVAG
jgi:hypothetical protein